MLGDNPTLQTPEAGMVLLWPWQAPVVHLGSSQNLTGPSCISLERGGLKTRRHLYKRL